MRQRWKDMLEAYGKVALGVYVVLCLFSFGASLALLRAGFHTLLPVSLLEVLPKDGTTLVAAYALYKALIVPRIAVAMAITPLVARWFGLAASPTRVA